ncbi:MAG: MFS transporter [Sinobacteraceae bacterium]|nr:MFS transporter [Nevskiaceae bacterium]MBV9912153.1 MFS transporter [Nevskiaceae bacterium]
MRYEQKLIWVLGITFGFLFFDRNAASYLMPFITAELAFSNQQVGLIAAALSFSWALSAFLGGALSDRTGKRKIVLLTSVVAFSLCSMLSGLASTFGALFAARLLMGLVEGPFLPVCQSLIALESHHERRGHNMGVMQNFCSNLLGSFAAPLILIPIAAHWSWRVAFFLAGIPGLIMTGLIARYVREPVAASHASGSSTPAVESIDYLGMLGYRNIILCILISIVMVAWMVLGWAFLPLYYIKVRGMSASQMSLFMSLLGISAACFSFVVPALSDRFGRRPVIAAFSLLGVMVPLAALYLNGALYVLATAIFVGWSASGVFPVFMGTVPSETIPARYVATSLGLVVGIGEILGGVSGPAAAGWAADRYGLQAPLLIQAACALCGALLALPLRETAPRRIGTAAQLHAPSG